MKPKTILCLAFALNCGLIGCSRSEQSVGAAEETQSALLRVVVIPSKTEVRVNELFSLALRVENATKTNQTVRMMSCSWEEEWRTSNPRIYWVGWNCQKNNEETVEIRPGGAYTNQLPVFMDDANPDKELSFRMGFTSIGSKKTNWSNEVKLRIPSSQQMKAKILLCLALVLSGVFPGGPMVSVRAENGNAPSADDWQTKAIASEADLDRVISLLQTPATRFDAMLTLLDFAASPQGRRFNHDPKVNALHAKATKAMDNCPGLDQVVATMMAGLQDPDKRLAMIAALLKLSGRFGGMQGYSPRNPLERLMDEASRAAHGAFDVPTSEKALQDPDWLLRITAVRHFGNAPEAAGEWRRLLPQMEKLAAGDDESIRVEAVESLRQFPGTEAFLAGRETKETSANVLMQLVDDPTRFLALFVPLLSNPDEKARIEALTFVAFNSARAPARQYEFGTKVFDLVIAATKAKSAAERSEAAAALTDMRKMEPDRSREVFLRLVIDPDENVRWQVAGGLKDQLERDDVKQAIAALLKDKSPVVRYMTIVLAVGPQKCIPELEELAKGADPQVADMAANTLKGLGR